MKPTDAIPRLNAALEGRYTVDRELGSGGMATVYLAYDARHARQVALKVLKPELAAVVGADRFLAEIKTTANLHHPHILPLYDSGDADGNLYYVMPYVEGETLKERIDRGGRLSSEEAVKIAIGVSSALGYAHERGVVHRDIKPANILMHDGEPIVADFGIALAIGDEGVGRATATGIAVGTVAYMSPEQAAGSRDVDGRADLYAVGCLVYEMVVGDAPFGGGRPEVVLARKVAGRLPDLARVAEGIPGTVIDVIEKAMNADPDARFQSAGDLGTALSAALDAETIRRRERVRRRGRALRIGIGLTAVVLATLGIRSLQGLLGTPSVRRLSVMPPSSIDSAEDREPLMEGIHGALINELSRTGLEVVGGVRSMSRFGASTMPIPAIADSLRVDALLESSVYWAGDSVRIDARLLDGDSEQALWTGSYVEDTRDVLALYRRISAAISEEIRPGIALDMASRLADVHEVDPEAYEAYLRAQFHWNRLTPADLETALRYLGRAIDADPEYAQAYAGIAWVRVAQQQIGMLPPSEATAFADEAAARAMNLNPQSPEAQYADGSVGWASWDWERAESGYRRALELDPGMSLVRGDYSHFLSVMGREAEAMAQIDRALEGDPLNIQLKLFRGVVLNVQGRYRDALGQFREVLEEVPNMVLALRGIRVAHERLGEEMQAIEAAAEVLRLRGVEGTSDTLMTVFREAGYREAMGRAAADLARISEDRFVNPSWVARWFGAAGRREETLTWVERCIEARDPNTPFFAVARDFEFLWGDPRFQALMERMGVSPPAA